MVFDGGKFDVSFGAESSRALIGALELALCTANCPDREFWEDCLAT
jgi:hypothetical protein